MVDLLKKYGLEERISDLEEQEDQHRRKKEE